MEKLQEKGGGVAFTILGDPQPKQRARVTKKGITYTPAKTKKAEHDLKMQALPWRPETPIQGPICMRIEVYRRIPLSFSKKKRAAAIAGDVRPDKKPDWDNYGKLVCDALNGIFYRDDAQIVEAIVLKYYSERPRLEIQLLWGPLEQ